MEFLIKINFLVDDKEVEKKFKITAGSIIEATENATKEAIDTFTARRRVIGISVREIGQTC